MTEVKIETTYLAIRCYNQSCNYTSRVKYTVIELGLGECMCTHTHTHRQRQTDTHTPLTLEFLILQLTFLN